MRVLCLSFALTFLDQASKHAVRLRLVPGEDVVVVPGFLNLRYVQNTGAAWGLLEGANHWLVALSLAVLIFLAAFRRLIIRDGALQAFALGLMVAGIAGNLQDRIRLGYVVDFLDFYWRTHHFPAFNVADTAICTGVGLYVLAQLLGDRRPSQDAALDVTAGGAPGADA